MIKVIGTKNHSPLSWAIRWLTKTDCSHLAIVFDDKFVIQANLLGVGMDYFPTFSKKQIIVHSVEIGTTLEGEDRIWSDLLDLCGGKDYDVKALIYDGWRYALKRFFKIPLPKKNKWSSPNKYLCTRMVLVLDIYLKEHFEYLSYGLAGIGDIDMMEPSTIISLIASHTANRGRL